MALLSLEAIILSLALLLTIINSSPHSLEFFYCLIILTFGACEARVALAILVRISRTYGNDIINTLSINKC
jgi:NADH:ubiquinone oxidoreductase subunit K